MIDILDIIEGGLAPPFVIDAASLPAVTLPCPGFSAIDTVAAVRSVDESNTPAALIEDASDELLIRREATIPFETLSDSERQQIIDAWANGLGCLRPFWYEVPGDGVERRWVFLDADLDLERANAARSAVTIRLLEVARPDLSSDRA